MEISTFNNSEFGEIRTIQKNGEVLFCGADVAKALGYSNTRDALSRHCKGVVKCDTPTNGGVQSLGFISEGDVYRLIAHSKLPGAERFERWVFDEVLPSIRKNGAYMTDDVLEQALTSPDFLIELATRLKAEKAKNAQLTVSNQIMQPKADYFDMLVDRNLLTGIRDTAKELGVRQNDFVRFLLDKGYLFSTKKGKLRPYAAYVDSGLFELKEFVNDKTGYCASASQMFRVPVEKHGVNGHLRQKGKIAELALGYGGSVGALKAMGALEMGLSEDELQPLVDMWRNSNPNIVQFWWAVDRCVKQTVKERIPTETHGIRFSYQSGMLFITLPSGRRLSYVKPRIGENKFGGESVTYEGVGGAKKWERIESYGPKFVENIVQAISRDILCYAMRTLRNYRICGHVHDELIIECPIDTNVSEVCEMMGRTPPWANGLPLRADGYECSFYKKD